MSTADEAARMDNIDIVEVPPPDADILSRPLIRGDFVMNATQVRAAGAGTLASMISEHIRRDIASAVFLPGQRLAVASLRERYSVGASPIREALNRLSAEGVVTQEDQRGFRVPNIDAADLAELTRTRCLINEVTLRTAIERADETTDAAIVVAFHRLRRLSPTRSGEKFAIDAEWMQAHRAFHSSLIASCGSRRLIEFDASLALRAEQYVVLSGYHFASRSPRRKPPDVEAEHRAIMEAVLDRDTERAIELANAHILQTKAVMDEFITATSRPGRHAASAAKRAAAGRLTGLARPI
jgi:DNA-binding GntR family transcriptional regulator